MSGSINALTTVALSIILAPIASENAAFWEDIMEFGYFTLSDNHYENNDRSSNQFVADITAEALYADKLGMHSAWIGDNHFNSLGVLSCPDLVLAYVAANTKRIRLAPRSEEHTSELQTPGR